jgi:alpha/beta hydrolase fold
VGVLLPHGFPEDSGQWLGQLPALAAAGFRAVAFDQRGYSSGVRPVEVDAYGPEDLIGDVLAGADALGWSRFDLVGHFDQLIGATGSSLSHREEGTDLGRRAAGRGGAKMRSILGGPRILVFPADRMVTTETQPLSQDRSEIPERHNFRCKASSRRARNGHGDSDPTYGNGWAQSNHWSRIHSS